MYAILFPLRFLPLSFGITDVYFILRLKKNFNFHPLKWNEWKVGAFNKKNKFKIKKLIFGNFRFNHQIILDDLLCNLLCVYYVLTETIFYFCNLLGKISIHFSEKFLARSKFILFIFTLWLILRLSSLIMYAILFLLCYLSSSFGITHVCLILR